MMPLRLAVLTAVLLSGIALGAEKTAPAKPKTPMGDFSLPKFDALPTGNDVVKPRAETSDDSPKVTAGAAAYEVIRIQYAKAFLKSPQGATPHNGSGMETIAISGNPPVTDKFVMMIRVRSKQRLNAPIEVAIVDPRGDTVMSSSGQVVFRGVKQDEVDYQIDWDPTSLRSGGDYKVLIRMAHQVMGTWPLKFVEASPAK